MKAIDVIGGLSWPSKMPCPSWSIPAKDCIVGSKLAQDSRSVCSGCYAMTGFYHMPNVQKAQEDRLQILRRAIADPSFRETFISAFVEVLENLRTRTRGKRYDVFRWFDSGDLQGSDHLDIVIEIANRCPTIRFWLPTKEYGTVHGRTFPANLTVRVSYAMIDQFGKPTPVFPTASAVYTAAVPSHVVACPVGVEQARKQCGDCRTCWDQTVLTVGYKLH